jgi:hypothetical protein
MQQQVLGVDTGNVIINNRLLDRNDPTHWEERYSTVPATDGVFDALKLLNERFNGEVHLVSRATDLAETRILAWLNDNNFFTYTGVKSENVHFVRERHEKDQLCKRLGVTHFIDDRLEVLSHMVDTVPHLYLYQPEEDEVEQFKEFLSRVTVVSSWTELLKSLGLSTFDSR